MGSLWEEQWCAEKQINTSGSKIWPHSNSVEALKNQIQEATEEKMLFELARIEALRDFNTIQCQRETELTEYYYQMEKKQKKMTEIVDEIYHSKNIQIKLANTMSDMNMLQNELNLLREMDNRRSYFRQEEELALPTVNGELNKAKKELAFIKEEVFQSMGALDIIRSELGHAMKEISKVQETEWLTELTIQNLNSKLLRATSRLKTAGESEKKASAITSSLTYSLEKLKTKSQAGKKDNMLINEEITSIESENQTTESQMDLNEEKLLAAMQELEAVVSSETVALAKLKLLADNTEKSRDSSSKHNSSIHLSKFEYAYLTGHAVYAMEVADKKVAAAEAWIEALKASEKEIVLRTELAHIEASELIRLEEERNMPSNRNTKVTEAQNMKVDVVLRRKSVTKNGNFMPARRTGFQLSKSPSTRRVSISDSINHSKRKMVMAALSKLFSYKSAEKM